MPPCFTVELERQAVFPLRIRHLELINLMSYFFVRREAVQLLFASVLSPKCLTRGFQNYLNHHIGCREHWGVVHLMRSDSGAHTIGHVALILRADHAIL